MHRAITIPVDPMLSPTLSSPGAGVRPAMDRLRKLFSQASVSDGNRLFSFACAAGWC